jgi:hypothetical protein
VCVLILDFEAQVFKDAVFAFSWLFNDEESAKDTGGEFLWADLEVEVFLGGFGSSKFLAVAVRTSN